MRRTVPILLGLALTSVMAANGAQASPNHLSGQRSAYLVRAVSQPVDWYPWGTAAFERAKELNGPILMNVGAVSCRWCDRMALYNQSGEGDSQHIEDIFRKSLGG